MQQITFKKEYWFNDENIKLLKEKIEEKAKEKKLSFIQIAGEIFWSKSRAEDLFYTRKSSDKWISQQEYGLLLDHWILKKV
jgi:hypothetical protein